MYEVKCHMKDAEEATYTKRWVQIQEGPITLKLWESDGEWSVVPLSSMYFYDVKIVE